ncbi:MAG: hypothetical protein GX962_15125 [Epulopiscium sp.]|nr:hypothetical protein [Candidatus Epulonipiscium sp.]
MNHHFYNKVIVVDNLCSPLYEKAIFIVKETETTTSRKNMVKEAEKIIETYIRSQTAQVVQKTNPVTKHNRDRILNWCLFGTSGLLIYYIIQLWM